MYVSISPVSIRKIPSIPFVKGGPRRNAPKPYCQRANLLPLRFHMAEREGFEPSVPLLVVHAISSRAPSASSDISPYTRLSRFRSYVFILCCAILGRISWRRGWDSNPRAPLFTGQVDFESTPLRPLRYLSCIFYIKCPFLSVRAAITI
jgi:hypothetical protein